MFVSINYGIFFAVSAEICKHNAKKIYLRYSNFERVRKTEAKICVETQIKGAKKQ